MIKKVEFVSILMLLFTVVLCFSGCEKLKMPIVGKMVPLDAGIREPQPLTVMTYNVYRETLRSAA